MSRPRPRPSYALGAVVAALLLVSCGNGSKQPQAQPAPEVTVFRGGAFDQLPRYPRSDQLNQPVETDNVVTQSFSVPNATPKQVLDFYHDHLPGWNQMGAVQASGTDSYQGAWVKGDRELRVTATKAPTLSKGQPVVQYSLELGPPRSASGPPS